MELLLKDGDYVSDGAGGQVRLEGEEALLQRVLFRLTARRGGFPLMPELGSRLYALGQERGGWRLPAARQYVVQALQEEPVAVETVALTDAGDGRIRLETVAVWDGGRLPAAVTI